MSGFTLAGTETMTLNRRGRLANMYVLSPFVWSQAGRYHLMVRAVPRRDDEPRLKMAEVWYGTSTDGLVFDMDEAPVIFPGPDALDLDGCEDPTVVLDGNEMHVWYTGWNQAEETGRLLRASGPGPRSLEKQGLVLDSTAEATNPKEATVAQGADGRWRLFDEFARDEHSLIGLHTADLVDDDWKPAELDFPPRPDSWDSWHLSTGPIVDAAGERPVMFYNGASRDAKWRIGWAAFDRDYSRIVDRSDAPLIRPSDLDEGDTDIAFAASAVECEDGEIWLFYSLADRELKRARVRRA